jgi:hypothetical protein
MTDRLQQSWTDAILARLAARYKETPEQCAETWAREAIKRGLDSLPDTMPTPSQFLGLCELQVIAQAPTPSPKTKKPQDDGYSGPRAWAMRLRDREQSGERLTSAVREMWRAGINYMPSGVD